MTKAFGKDAAFIYPLSPFPLLALLSASSLSQFTRFLCIHSSQAHYTPFTNNAIVSHFTRFTEWQHSTTRLWFGCRVSSMKNPALYMRLFWHSGDSSFSSPKSSALSPSRLGNPVVNSNSSRSIHITANPPLWLTPRAAQPASNLPTSDPRRVRTQQPSDGCHCRQQLRPRRGRQHLPEVIHRPT